MSAFGGKADIVLTLSAEMFGRMCALVQCYRGLACKPQFCAV